VSALIEKRVILDMPSDLAGVGADRQDPRPKSMRARSSQLRALGRSRRTREATRGVSHDLRRLVQLSASRTWTTRSASSAVQIQSATAPSTSARDATEATGTAARSAARWCASAVGGNRPAAIARVDKESGRQRGGCAGGV